MRASSVSRQVRASTHIRRPEAHMASPKPIATRSELTIVKVVDEGLPHFDHRAMPLIKIYGRRLRYWGVARESDDCAR
jgi:hypothetical protein